MFSVTFTIDGFAVDSSGETLMTSETNATTGSDSGPTRVTATTSGSGSRRPGRWVNRLVISVAGPSGAASLEGGADGTGPCDADDGCTEGSLGQPFETTDSLFHLVETDGLADPTGALEAAGWPEWSIDTSRPQREACGPFDLGCGGDGLSRVIAPKGIARWG